MHDVFVRGYVAPTDQSWFDFHAERRPREVNFWRPSGAAFRAIAPGDPFFFKLKSPHNSIGGAGFYARSDQIPLWLAWETYGEANGVASQEALVERLRRIRAPNSVDPTSVITCISIVEPVFLPASRWIDVPADWRGPIVAGKTYDMREGEGLRLWQEVQARSGHFETDTVAAAIETPRFGRERVTRSRLGQGSFKLAVLDAYERACSITQEHSLPVLEAAHIKPYALGGSHDVSNGLVLRRDLHRLFDLGYVTIRMDYTLVVSRRLDIEFHNGRTYYELDGMSLHLPPRPEDRPDRDALEWHNDVVYRAS